MKNIENQKMLRTSTRLQNSWKKSNHKNDRRDFKIFIERAQVNAQSTTNIHFGLLDTAEMILWITINCIIKNLTFAQNFKYFHHFGESFNFTCCFRPKYCSNRKVFCRDESF